jgi:hypothetical protein
VNLIKINVVGLQAAQRILHLAGQPASRIALLVRIIAHREVRLGGEHDVGAPAFESLPDDLLRLAAAIGIGGVDEVDPCIQSLVDDPDRVVVVGIARRAEHHRAQAIRADFDAGSSKRAVLQSHLLMCIDVWPTPPCCAS